jgi:hypothetical protein
MSEKESTESNCFGCGRATAQVNENPQHQPRPNATESDRCRSRPRKYADLQCRLAVGHECVHSARMTGTGMHYWRDEAAQQ